MGSGEIVYIIYEVWKSGKKNGYFFIVGFFDIIFLS